MNASPTPFQSGAKECQIGQNKPEYGKGTPFLHTAESSHSHYVANTSTVSKDLEKDVMYIKARRISDVALVSEKCTYFLTTRIKGYTCFL